MFRVGAVFGQSIRTFFRNFVPFFVLSALGLIVFLGFVFAMFAGYYDSFPILGSERAMLAFIQQNQSGLIVRGIITIILAFAIFLAVNAALVYGTIIDLRGKSAGIGECVSRGITIVPKAVGISILLSLALAAVMIAGGTIAYLFAFQGSALPMIVMIGTVGITVFLMIKWYVVIPAVVVEDTGVMGAFSRSSQLTSNNRWKILGLILLSGIVSSVVSYLASLLENALFSAGSFYIPLAIEFILQAVFIGFGAVLIAVVYHDLRVAKEGLGTDEIAAVFD